MSLDELRPERLFSLDGRAAVITGAAGGLGRRLAAGLRAAGADVLATDFDEPRLDEVARELDAHAFVYDLTAADAPERIVGACVDRFGRIDVLVNCAAVNRRLPILEMTPETYDFVMDLGLRVPYFLSQAAARAMIDAGHGGSIVGISSVNAAFGLEQVSVYGPAKAGLSQLTKVMAMEWSRHGIRANCIAPGFFDTPLAAPLWQNADRARWLLNRVPLKRPGRPDELVGTLLLLASDAGSFLTGQTIYVDGGFLAGGTWFTPDE